MGSLSSIIIPLYLPMNALSLIEVGEIKLLSSELVLAAINIPK